MEFLERFFKVNRSGALKTAPLTNVTSTTAADGSAVKAIIEKKTLDDEPKNRSRKRSRSQGELRG